MEITLEKVDKVIERTGVSYKEAKEALEISEGEVLEAIIYIEENKKNTEAEKGEKGQTIEEFKIWLKELVNKGNVARIKIKKEEQVLVDIPVNAGIAATVIGLVIPPLLAFGVIAAVATKVTIEITKTDGSVEVVNKYISKATDEVVSKASDMAEGIKNKFSGTNVKKKQKVDFDDNTVFTYKVDFDDEEKEK